MKLKYLSSLIEPQTEVAKIRTLAFSPNNRKLAVATADLHVVLFDEKFARRDKFATKPVDSKFGKKSFIVTSLVFSPDSTKLAVGQSDNIVFVYRLGETWEEKKVICNKFAQSSPVTSLIWPEENRLIIGLIDGKVRYASAHSNKCSTVYKTEAGVIALAQSPNRRTFVSGHEDSAVILFSFDTRTQTKICVHTTPPYCLLLSNFGILAAGADKRIVSYNEQGKILQEFDFSKDDKERSYSCAVIDPSGYNAMFACYNRLRLMTWSQRRGAWDSGQTLTATTLYTVSALAWKPDGSTIICGNQTGLVMAIDCSLKRKLIKNQFETTFVSPSQVVVRDINSDVRTIVRSEKGLSITDIRVMGQTNRYVIGYTAGTLILVDRETEKSSEIPWESGGNEKFYLDNENVCMIMNAGEISFIEYGRNEVAGWIRTERLSPHLISARLNERRRGSAVDIRRVAYMLDARTIALVDLITGNQISQINHSHVVDWLELNESGDKLLFRDVRSSLYLFDVSNEKTSSMINFCSYVQWVPQSDVVVVQSGDQLCVWYNTDHIDQVTQIPIQGDVESVLRDNNRTEVIVQEATAKVAYELDNSMIEFGTAIDDLDLARAVVFLEESEQQNVDVSPMWKQLAEVAIQQKELLIAQRAYASLKDYSRVSFIAETLRIAEEAAGYNGMDINDYRVRARIAIMGKRFKEAERIYLEQNSVTEAIEMYQKLYRWGDALELAKATNYADLENLKTKYYRNLYETGQEEKVAEIKEKEGDPLAAVDLYVKSNHPAHAARILLDNERFTSDVTLVNKVIAALERFEIYDKAGQLHMSILQFHEALEAFRKGKVFNKAIEVARVHFPEKVTGIEEDWGNELCASGKFDNAINHYLEAGKSSSAAEAAIKAKEWDRVLPIIDTIETTEARAPFFGKIAEHFETLGDYDQAEKFYIDAGRANDAIDMFSRAGKWAHAFQLSAEFMGPNKAKEIYAETAADLERQNRLADAEELYLSIGEPNRAIAMYRAADRNEDMMRLIEKYHGDRVEETHLRLAKDFEQKGDFREAEEQYLKSGDWKSAVNMYQTAEQWAEAYRIAKAHSDESRVYHKLAYLWAKSLGGDSAVKLLQRQGVLNEAIDLGTEMHDYEFVFELCRLGAKGKLADAQAKYAGHLEDAGDFKKAEEYYLLSGKPQEAVLMHMHNQNWSAAEAVARDHASDVLNDVYIAQARAAIEEGNHHTVETYLLRANQAEIVVKYYREKEMWLDALRIAKEYAPDLLPELEEEYDKYQLKSGAKGAASFLVQGRELESQGDYRRAIQSYIRIDETTSTDKNLIVEAQRKAGELAAKFLDEREASELLNKIAKKLVALGKGIDAGEVLLLGNQPEAAVLALIEANEWAKAKRVASELVPHMEANVDEAYTEYLKNQGRIGDLIDVDVIAAIDVLVERGNWDKALTTAKQQNHPALLDKYVAAYITELMGQDQTLEAVRVLERYGVSTNEANFNIYKQLIDQIVNIPENDYETIASLRNVIFMLTEKLQDPENGTNPGIVQIFDRYVYVLHFYALLAALRDCPGPAAEKLKLEIRIGLARYLDLLMPDKVLYEAGMACRNAGRKYENLAFVFLNVYLDVVDAIEDGDASIVDTSVFEGTDVPTQFGLPSGMFLNEEAHEDVKEWVLAVSVDRRVAKELPLDQRGVYEASTIDADGQEYPVCAVSSYPVIAGAKELGNDVTVSADSWQAFVAIFKTNANDGLFDVQQFFARWTKSQLNLSL